MSRRRTATALHLMTTTDASSAVSLWSPVCLGSINWLDSSATRERESIGLLTLCSWPTYIIYMWVVRNSVRFVLVDFWVYTLWKKKKKHYIIQCDENQTNDFLFHSQAEELNTIVGNAFRMAYVAQLQRQPMLQDVINSKSGSHFRKDSKLQQQQEQQQPQEETRGGAVWVSYLTWNYRDYIKVRII